MDGHRLISSLSHFIHAHFLWFLLGSYAAAVFWPAFGLWIRDVSVGEVAFIGERSRITLPMLMLALLLLNAGLGVKASRLRNLLRSAPLLGVGLFANLLIPIAFIFGVSQIMRPWHEPDEVQNLLVGLALVASMLSVSFWPAAQTPKRNTSCPVVAMQKQACNLHSRWTPAFLFMANGCPSERTSMGLFSATILNS